MRGQASVEYVAALALLVCILAGAGVAVAAPDLPGAVVAQLRLALCIVGGDVCRNSDAAARGLEPCVVSVEDHERETGISFLLLRAGGTEFWSLERRSDGRLLLTVGYGQDIGATGGVGLEVGEVSGGGSVTGSLRFRSGKTWAITEEQLRAVLAATEGDPTQARLVLPFRLGPPAETFLEGGGDGAAELAVEAVRELSGGGAEARALLGFLAGPEAADTRRRFGFTLQQ